MALSVAGLYQKVCLLAVHFEMRQRDRRFSAHFSEIDGSDNDIREKSLFCCQDCNNGVSR